MLASRAEDVILALLAEPRYRVLPLGELVTELRGRTLTSNGRTNTTIAFDRRRTSDYSLEECFDRRRLLGRFGHLIPPMEPATC